jgi:PTH1 family peptidyl-tRNA hydrolase
MTAAGSPKLLAFLGNPGTRYAPTRHNIAWRLLEHQSFSGCDRWQRKFRGLWARCTLRSTSVVLLKPETMMNLCGESVQAASRFFRIPPEEVLVVHDEVELQFGKAGIRLGGGLAGHNGLRSVARHLGTREFWRLRIGVGRPQRGDLQNYVLGRFTRAEEAILPDFIDGAANYLCTALEDGPRSGPVVGIVRAR